MNLRHALSEAAVLCRIRGIGAAFLLIGALFAAPVQANTSNMPLEWDQAEFECMALNMYHEARQEGYFGMIAVGWVVLNRMDDPKFPDSACKVIRQGGHLRVCQFSWYCDGKSDTPHEVHAWRMAQIAARDLITGLYDDVTGGALFYHATYVSPGWAKRLERTEQFGQHIYYR